MKRKNYSKVAALAAAPLLGLSSAMAVPSAYVTDVGTTATQITEDINAIIPVALGIAGIVLAVTVGWSIFRRLAR